MPPFCTPNICPQPPPNTNVDTPKKHSGRERVRRTHTHHRAHLWCARAWTVGRCCFPDATADRSRPCLFHACRVAIYIKLVCTPYCCGSALLGCTHGFSYTTTLGARCHPISQHNSRAAVRTAEDTRLQHPKSEGSRRGPVGGDVSAGVHNSWGVFLLLSASRRFFVHQKDKSGRRVMCILSFLSFSGIRIHR